MTWSRPGAPAWTGISGLPSAGGGSAAPVPTLVGSLYGATLVDPNSLDAGSTGFSSGTFRINMGTGGSNNDGINDGIMHWLIPLGTGGLEPDLDFSAGDVLVVTVTAVGSLFSAANSNQFIGVGVVTGTPGAGATGIGHTAYRSASGLYRAALWTATSSSSGAAAVASSTTHMQAYYERTTEGSSSDMRIITRTTDDDGTTWKSHTVSTAANVGTASPSLIIGGGCIGTPSNPIDVSLRVYTHIQRGAAADYATIT